MKGSDINPLELFAEGNPKVRQKRELYFWIQKAEVRTKSGTSLKKKRSKNLPAFPKG